MSTLRPYKFLVVPVAQLVDDDGTVIDEVSPKQPVPIFGVDGLRTYADNFEMRLMEQSAEMNGVVLPDRGGD